MITLKLKVLERVSSCNIYLRSAIVSRGYKDICVYPGCLSLTKSPKGIYFRQVALAPEENYLEYAVKEPISEIGSEVL
jgi:hypothetical protein